MEIEVKGHSGCAIEVVDEGGDLYVYKSTRDRGYLKRLVDQARKQMAAAEREYQHVRVPRILEIKQSPDEVVLKMEYVYSRNFIEYFEQAGFEQVNYLVIALELFLEKEIERCTPTLVSADIVRCKFGDVESKCRANKHLQGDDDVETLLERSRAVFADMPDMELPVGVCHGDLTFSNILFNGNNYYLIDFLDSFIESPLLDVVKIRQDTAYGWSQLMYTKAYDAVRLSIVSEAIDSRIDAYFAERYRWYADFYRPMQLMNFLRVLQYAHDDKVIQYLKRVITSLL